MDLSILFLGTAGAVPTAKRGLASQLVRRGGDRILFDCGEGTQRQLLRSVGLLDIESVFLTHYHADHYLGLAGMLKSFDLRDRTEPMAIFGPPGLNALFAVLKRIFGRLSFPVELVEMDHGDVERRDGYRIVSFPTHHTRESAGYVLVENDRPGRFDRDRARELGVPEGPEWGKLQRGGSVRVGDREVRSAEVVGAARMGRKLVITGDTAPSETTRVVAHGADLLVHEATFADEEAVRAAETGHATATQAAEVAAEAEVKMLALTHISNRYFGGEIKAEAREIFPNTAVPYDLDLIELPLPERGEPILRKAGGRPKGE